MSLPDPKIILVNDIVTIAHDGWTIIYNRKTNTYDIPLYSGQCQKINTQLGLYLNNDQTRFVVLHRERQADYINHAIKTPSILYPSVDSGIINPDGTIGTYISMWLTDLNIKISLSSDPDNVVAFHYQ